jgi:hypothetical protein
MARPKAQVDPSKVEALAAIGCTAAEIGAELDCHERTIERRFAPVLKNGEQKRKTRIRHWLYKQAAGGNTAIIIFLAKCELGMKEPRDDAVNVQVNTIAANNVFAVTDQAKKHFAEIDQLVRRETSLLSGNGNGQHND